MEGRRFVPILACGLLALLFAGTAVASAHVVRLDYAVKESVVIPEGEFHAYSLHVSAGESVWIEAASAGAAIDVYSLDSMDFGAYANATGDFVPFTPGSREGVTRFAEEFTPGVDGNYYVILDNAARSGSGSQPSGDVQVAVFLERSSTPTDPNFGGAAVLVAAAMGWVAFLVLARVRPADPRTGWQRRSWWQKPVRPIPDEPVEYNAFSPAGDEKAG